MSNNLGRAIASTKQLAAIHVIHDESRRSDILSLSRKGK